MKLCRFILTRSKADLSTFSLVTIKFSEVLTVNILMRWGIRAIIAAAAVHLVFVLFMAFKVLSA